MPGFMPYPQGAPRGLQMPFGGGPSLPYPQQPRRPVAAPGGLLGGMQPQLPQMPQPQMPPQQVQQMQRLMQMRQMMQQAQAQAQGTPGLMQQRYGVSPYAQMLQGRLPGVAEGQELPIGMRNSWDNPFFGLQRQSVEEPPTPARRVGLGGGARQRNYTQGGNLRYQGGNPRTGGGDW